MWILRCRVELRDIAMQYKRQPYTCNHWRYLSFTKLFGSQKCVFYFVFRWEYCFVENLYSKFGIVQEDILSFVKWFRIHFSPNHHNFESEFIWKTINARPYSSLGWRVKYWKLMKIFSMKKSQKIYSERQPNLVI